MAFEMFWQDVTLLEVFHQRIQSSSRSDGSFLLVRVLDCSLDRVSLKDVERT